MLAALSPHASCALIVGVGGHRSRIVPPGPITVTWGNVTALAVAFPDAPRGKQRRGDDGYQIENGGHGLPPEQLGLDLARFGADLLQDLLLLHVALHEQSNLLHQVTPPAIFAAQPLALEMT